MANLQERLDDFEKRIKALEKSNIKRDAYIAQKVEDAEGVASEIRQTLNTMASEEEKQKQFIAQKIEDAEGVATELRERLSKLEAILLPQE